jgi:hypothetical protein
MPTYTTITENQDGTFSVTVHDAAALRRIQTMCDVIRDDHETDDEERNAIADYAEDLYRVINDALYLYTDRVVCESFEGTCPNCPPNGTSGAPCADCTTEITTSEITTAEDPDDCAYCSGDGSQHCTHLLTGDTECPDCGGDGAFPSRSGGNVCEGCNGTGNADTCQTCGTTNDLHRHGTDVRCHACRLDDDLRAAGILPAPHHTGPAGLVEWMMRGGTTQR